VLLKARHCVSSIPLLPAWPETKLDTAILINLEPICASRPAARRLPRRAHASRAAIVLATVGALALCAGIVVREGFGALPEASSHNS
jgi:hypothetical protein